MDSNLEKRINAIVASTDTNAKANIKARALAISLLLGTITDAEAESKLRRIEKLAAKTRLESVPDFRAQWH